LAALDETIGVTIHSKRVAGLTTHRRVPSPIPAVEVSARGKPGEVPHRSLPRDTGSVRGGGSEGGVWIAEDLDEEDSFLLTGRFTGYFERGRGLTEE
jgi:hypothetical protein